MKKRILMAVAMLSASAFASTAFAATISSTTSIGGLGFTPSNKVTVSVVSSSGNPTAVPPDPGSYAATSWHASGSRSFGTDSTKSVIYWSDGTGTAATAGMNFGSWTSM